MSRPAAIFFFAAAVLGSSAATPQEPPLRALGRLVAVVVIAETCQIPPDARSSKVGAAARRLQALLGVSNDDIETMFSELAAQTRRQHCPRLRAAFDAELTEALRLADTAR